MLHNTIGERLRRMMAEHGFSAAQLAKNANVKPSFIYDIINGKSTNPSIVKLAHIANVLNINISLLIGNEPENYSARSHTLRSKKYRLECERNHSNDYVTIAGLLVQTSHNGKSVIAADERRNFHLFCKHWIQNHLQVSPFDLRLLFVPGDNMEPTLGAGDIILVDTTKRHPSPVGIFVLFDGFGLIVKRLESISNTTPPIIRIISDNLQYSTYERVMDELHIIGRVVWFARAL